MLADKLKTASASAPNVAWDLAYAYYNPPAGKWDISTADFVKSLNVSAQEFTVKDVFFKPDGTSMYIVGDTGVEVNQYTLSIPWDVASATFLRLFSVAAQVTTPTGIFFKPDGLSMYIVDQTGDDVNQYTLTTAWDISTASYLQNFSVTTQESAPRGIFFKPDGLSMYIVGPGSVRVNQYTLSTAWDISTASFLQFFSVSAEETLPSGIFFKPDGLSMYVLGYSGDDVNQYTLSTAWDVSTASFTRLFSVAGVQQSPLGLFFKPDGTAMYIAGIFNDGTTDFPFVSQFSFGGFPIGVQDATPSGIFFKPDGLTMYMSGNLRDRVNQYTLTTAWDSSTAAFLQLLLVSGQDTNLQDVFFSPDGTSMYTVGSTNDRVYQYTLSTAWNIATATFLQFFSVASQELTPTGLYFSPDGTRMYICGTSGIEVNQYALSTAWNISTASFVQLFSVSAQETVPNGIFFKTDGTAMYIIGSTGDDVNQYTLTTAWDISTASYSKNFSLASQGTAPTGFFFKPDGNVMYTIDAQEDRVFQYSIGV